jgi:hypothetical protein
MFPRYELDTHFVSFFATTSQLRVIFIYAAAVRNYEISVVIVRKCRVVFAVIWKLKKLR